METRRPLVLAILTILFGSARILPGKMECAAQPATEPPAADAADVAEGTPPEDETVLPAPKLPAPPDATKLPDPDQVWVDGKQRRVYVDGHVSLREGYLEMFACTVGTKEHESIVAARTRAATVHAALLSVGAVEGHPVRYNPKFEPATGTEVNIEVQWLDAQGQWKTARAQDWVIDKRTKKTMEQRWVFGGSGFWTDDKTGKRYYMAEQGDFICVSNFTTAMLDLPIESSQSTDGLLFEANPERVPELGTPVRLVLWPKLEPGAKSAGPAAK